MHLLKEMIQVVKKIKEVKVPKIIIKGFFNFNHYYQK